MSFFAVSADIRRRIEAALPSVVVSEPRSVDQLKTTLGAAPIGVAILYKGYGPEGESGWGSYVCIRQTWWVVVVVKGSAQGDIGQAQRDMADEAVTAILRTLPGAQPALGNAFQYHLAPAPDMATEPGWAYIPLAFSTILNFTGAKP